MALNLWGRKVRFKTICKTQGKKRNAKENNAINKRVQI